MGLKYYLAAAGLWLLSACQNQPEPHSASFNSPEIENTTATPDGAWLQDWEQTKDPDLGRPAPERLLPVVQQIQQKVLQEGFPGDTLHPWVARGPYDVGGRTRAIMFDPNDATAKKVWAGGVSGGLWYNNDITDPASEWQKVNDFWDNLSITALAADPNDNNIFYAATGEGWNILASGTRGAGIWKSTDGGASWSQLSATADFYFVNDLVVRDESGSSVVYAGVERFFYAGVYHGTEYGLQRSTNGGTSWTQVLPTIPGGSRPYSVADIELDANNDLWIGTITNSLGNGGGRVLTSSNGTTWTVSVSVTGGDRVELACAPSNSNYIYGLVETSNVVAAIIRTTDGGSNWSTVSEPSDADNGIPGTDFSRGQAWYDLIAAVHPSDPTQLLVGGINLFRSTNSGSSWSQISKWSNNPDMDLLNCALVHADQHQIIFRPGFNNEVVFGTDGGVYYCSDITSAASSNVIQPRNNAYNVTQFYSCAMHPDEGESYYLAGSQDNGTQRFTKSGLGSTVQATGGDGSYCHIDSTDPSTQITSYTGNNFDLSTNGGVTFTTLISESGGLFINPSDYHDLLNLLYSADNSNGVLQIDLGGTFSVVPIAMSSTATHIRVSPHTTASVNLFVGNSSGELFKVTSANSSPSATNISGPSFPSATISCIEVGGSEDTLLVSFSNYGVNSLWYTTNGGSTWVSKEGDLPDMPVRWALINPNDGNEAILATELGVWRCTDLSAASPQWVSSTSGLATVRTDMLQMRNSDHQVIAGTHGRGLFSSDAWAEQAPLAQFAAISEQIGVNMPLRLEDQSSANPSSWSWSFTPDDVIYLQGTGPTSQHPVVQFPNTGSYTVELTASNSYGSDVESKIGYLNVVTPKSLSYSQNFDGFSTCAIANSCGLSCTLSDDWLNASNSESDDSDWMAYTGSTFSTGTGPSGDNTSGSGNYLYTESSGCFNREMLLYSPVIDLYGAANPSLSFAYHMYGAAMGELELSIYLDGEWQLIWQQLGNLGNSWQTANLDLSNYSGRQVLFRFRGYTGSSFTSDMAIDDFSISENVLRWDGGAATSNWSDANNWSTDVVPDSGATVTLDNTFVAGSYSIAVDERVALNQLVIDMGANTLSLSGSEELRVSGLVNPQSGTLNSNGQLRLAALSETEYGQVAAGGGSISGVVENEWYFAGPSGYRHIASPVVCNLSEIAAEFTRLQFSSGSAGSIWGWDPSTSYWYAPSGSGASFDEAFSVFFGSSFGLVFTSLPFRMDAAGSLKTGNQSQTLTYSVGNPADFVDPGENAGWNFLDNPYPSALDWELVEADAGFPAELSATKYTWDPVREAYSSYNANTQTSVRGGTALIAKGQSVWVQLNSSPGGGSTTLNLQDNMRSTASAPKVKGMQSLHSRIGVEVRQGEAQDELRFGRFRGATSSYDHQYDHLEMDNQQYRLSVFSGQQRRMAYNLIESYRYPLPFSVISPHEEAITLQVKSADFLLDEAPRYLRDLNSGILHPLSDGPYRYVPLPGEERSFLLLKERWDENRDPDRTVEVFLLGGRLALSLADHRAYDRIRLFNTRGQLVLEQALAPEFQQEIEFWQRGVFILHLSGPDGAHYSEKLVSW